MQNSSHVWQLLPYRQLTLDNSGFSLTEQCDPLPENQLSEHSMPSLRSISAIYFGRKRWLWSGFDGKCFRCFLGGEVWHVFWIWVRFDFNLLLHICFWLYACSGSSPGGIGCFAYANCFIEGSNGAGCSEANSNQSSKEGNVTRKQKPWDLLETLILYIYRGWWHT